MLLDTLYEEIKKNKKFSKPNNALETYYDSLSKPTWVYEYSLVNTAVSPNYKIVWHSTSSRVTIYKRNYRAVPKGQTIGWFRYSTKNFLIPTHTASKAYGEPAAAFVYRGYDIAHPYSDYDRNHIVPNDFLIVRDVVQEIYETIISTF